jgi:hypothetical protein
MSNPQELLQQLSALSGSFASLGTRLSLAAGELKNLGTPPAASLVEELARYRQTFEQLRDAALTLARASTIPAQAIPANLVSVRELEAFVRSLIPVGTPANARQQALSAIDRLLAARHAQQPDFAPLAECQAQLRPLREAIANASDGTLPQVAISIAQGGHPLCSLLQLIDATDLDDEQWAQLQEAVAGAFGRSLAAAVSRNHLVVPPASAVQTLTTPRPVAQTPAPANVAAPLGAQDLVFKAPGAVNLGTAGVPAGFKVLLHIQGLGDRVFPNGEIAGTRGESRAIEGMQIDFEPRMPGLGVRYMGHVQGSGDTPWVPEGQYIGTRGEGRRLEGFAVELTGPEAAKYDVCYMGHFARYGDSNEMKNGELCGVRGQGLQLEAVKVWIRPKMV